MARNMAGQTTLNLTDIEIAYFLGLGDAGLPHRDIAGQVRQSQSAVTCVAQRYDLKTFRGVILPWKSIDELEQRTIVHEVKKNRQRSLPELPTICPTIYPYYSTTAR